MSDPISVYPDFVRNQKYPPTTVPSGRTLVQNLSVVVADTPVQATIQENDIGVTVSPRNITVEV